MFRVLLLCVLLPTIVFSQQTVTIVVSDSVTNEAVVGARIELVGKNTGRITNAGGTATIELQNGAYTASISAPHFTKQEHRFIVPLADPVIRIQLAPLESEGGEIVVEATRGNRTISTIPTRVEVLTEEIDEAAAMDPSKISHVITHSTGIQLQTTSATSNTANVRIQGLDGRYTQILKDGFPLYGGYSGSLSIMQIPPLDLKQIEYIKGSASTLYGGGAIAGLINLISKDPSKDETLLHMNYSSLGTTDLNAFYSRRHDQLGVTMLASNSLQQAYDADGDGFSDVPQILKLNFNPKLFYYFDDHSRLIAGAGFTLEDRSGGDMAIVNDANRDSMHFYNETNYSTRINTQLLFSTQLSDDVELRLRNALSFFDRAMTIVPHTDSPLYRFGGKQRVNFSEASVSAKLGDEHLFIGGVNLIEDDFKETHGETPDARNESNLVIGGFLQDTWTPSTFFSTELGFRGDYSTEYGFFPLPRVSMLFKWTNELSSRLGVGLGYRLPSIFNQEADVLGYQGVAPIDYDDQAYLPAAPERSLGANFDIHYKTHFGESVALSINQLFFFSRVNDPLVLTRFFTEPQYPYGFINGFGQTRTQGFETAIKLTVLDFTLFVGYTYTDAVNTFPTERPLVLTPKHSLKGDLLYVLPGMWRIGWDYEYKGSQTLSDGHPTKALLMTGVVIERTIGQFVLFLNLENITDERQTRYESLINGPNYTPQFTEVWAPLDGFFINGGIKVTL